MPTYYCNIQTPFLITSQNSCTATCPDGSYGESTTLTCQPCLSQCARCTNPNNCTYCPQGEYLRNDSFCYTTCPTGSVANDTTRTCDQCVA